MLDEAVGISFCANPLWKVLIYLFSFQIGLFGLGKTTSAREGKL